MGEYESEMGNKKAVPLSARLINHREVKFYQADPFQNLLGGHHTSHFCTLSNLVCLLRFPRLVCMSRLYYQDSSRGCLIKANSVVKIVVSGNVGT